MSFLVTSILLCAYATYAQVYDTINVAPRCFGAGICTAYGRAGANYSWHEMAEERTQRAFMNAARMHPRQYITSPWGRFQFGTFGPQTVFDTGTQFCGVAPPRPMYFHSDTIESARWHQWDSANCDVSTGHNTCPSRCHLFGGDCGFGARVRAFVGRDGARASAEGLCGANMCYTSGHCGAIFDPATRYVGAGFWFQNGITNVYTQNGPAIDYPIPSGAHFDQSIKTNRDFFRPGGNMNFMMNWWRPGTHVARAYVAYNGRLNVMNRTMGSTDNGVYEWATAVPSQCQPYYFIVRTTGGTRFRLPQGHNFLFGTSWDKWEWWNPPSPCNENHYFVPNNGPWVPPTSGTWAANGGPGVAGRTGSACQGCSRAQALVNLWNSA